MYKNPRLRGRLTVAIAAASLAAIALAGCGAGGGNDNSSPATTNSPFAGTYAGTFSTTNPQSGTLNVTVGTDGTLTGTGHNNTTGQDETISGSVTNSGGANVKCLNQNKLDLEKGYKHVLEKQSVQKPGFLNITYFSSSTYFQVPSILGFCKRNYCCCQQRPCGRHIDAIFRRQRHD